LRPELIYITATVDKFRKDRSIKIGYADQALTSIANNLYSALIEINRAAQMEDDSALPHDKAYLQDYHSCFLDCADHLRNAYLQVGGIGKEYLKPPPVS
jgi:hypothetical protein